MNNEQVQFHSYIRLMRCRADLRLFIMVMEVYELNRIIKKWLKWPIRFLLLTILVVGGYLYLYDHPTWMRIFYGTQDLGNHFYSMPWDGGHDIVIYNDNVQNDEVYSGMRVIDDYHVVITDIKYNDRWIAMTTYNDENQTNSWYILDKKCIPSNVMPIDSIICYIQKGLILYNTKDSFERAMQERNL